MKTLTLPALACVLLLPLISMAQDTPQIALPVPVAPAATPPPPPPPPTLSPVPGPTGQTSPTTSRPPVAADGIRLNFQGAQLSDVLNYLSEAAGFVIVQEAPVSGTVNVVSRQSISPDEAIDLLNAVLIEKGYIALRSGRILKIVNRKDAQKRDLPVMTGSDPEKIPRKDEMVTQILPLRFGEAAKLLENIRPLLSENATISANESSNSILLTDTQTNVRRVAQIIQAIDTSVSSISTIRVFPLTYADAKEVATIVSQLFSSGTSGSSSGGRGDRGGRGFGGFPGFGGFGGSSQPATTAQSEAKQAASRVVAVADEQSNSLIVAAPEEVMPTIKEIIVQIDTSTTAVTETRIFRLQHADSVEMADLFNTLFTDESTTTQNRGNQGGRRDRGGGGFGFPFGPFGQPAQTSQQTERELQQARVNAVGDPRTNSLIVTASRETMTQIAEMVGRLDATDAKKQRVFVHSLEHADAENVASILRNMFGDPSGSGSRAGTQQTSRLIERTTTGATSEAADAFSSGARGGGGAFGR